MLNWPTKHVTSLTLLQANRQVKRNRSYSTNTPADCYVYSFLSVGPTYRAMGKVVACRTIFISNLSL